jgi:hypothetical protein
LAGALKAIFKRFSKTAVQHLANLPIGTHEKGLLAVGLYQLIRSTDERTFFYQKPTFFRFFAAYSLRQLITGTTVYPKNKQP